MVLRTARVSGDKQANVFPLINRFDARQLRVGNERIYTCVEVDGCESALWVSEHVLELVHRLVVVICFALPATRCGRLRLGRSRVTVAAVVWLWRSASRARWAFRRRVTHGWRRVATTFRSVVAATRLLPLLYTLNPNPRMSPAAAAELTPELSIRLTSWTESRDVFSSGTSSAGAQLHVESRAG